MKVPASRPSCTRASPQDQTLWELVNPVRFEFGELGVVEATKKAAGDGWVDEI